MTPEAKAARSMAAAVACRLEVQWPSCFAASGWAVYYGRGQGKARAEGSDPEMHSTTLLQKTPRDVKFHRTERAGHSVTLILGFFLHESPTPAADPVTAAAAAAAAAAVVAVGSAAADAKSDDDTADDAGPESLRSQPGLLLFPSPAPPASLAAPPPIPPPPVALAAPESLQTLASTPTWPSLPSLLT
jgi:hypothetical protein